MGNVKEGVSSKSLSPAVENYKEGSSRKIRFSRHTEVEASSNNISNTSPTPEPLSA